MGLTRREGTMLLLSALVIVTTSVPWAVPAVRGRVFPSELSSPERGRRIAERLGCFGCHGPGGTGGVANPGSRMGMIPSFTGGVPMMWSDDAGQIAEWIRDGHRAGHERKQDGLLSMPAFGSALSDPEVADLVAFILSRSPLESPSDPHVVRGLELARANACFGCHGPLGSGGTGNAGSLKGYIPGWSGKDFDELAHGDAEIEEWIRTGRVRRLTSNPAAAWILEHEAIRMPAFENLLQEDEIADLVAAVKWIRQGAPDR